MQVSDIALLAASAAAVFLVIQSRQGGGGGSTWVPWKSVASYDGYQYYNDGAQGLVITPAGDYVLNGVTVWSPRGLA